MIDAAARAATAGRAGQAAGSAARPTRRQASEQYFTASQSRAHFFRHANGRPQATQVLLGRSRLAGVLRDTRGGGFDRVRGES